MVSSKQLNCNKNHLMQRSDTSLVYFALLLLLLWNPSKIDKINKYKQKYFLFMCLRPIRNFKETGVPFVLSSFFILSLSLCPSLLLLPISLPLPPSLSHTHTLAPPSLSPSLLRLTFSIGIIAFTPRIAQVNLRKKKLTLHYSNQHSFLHS